MKERQEVQDLRLKLVKLGVDAKLDVKLNKTQPSAWTSLCITLLNNALTSRGCMHDQLPTFSRHEHPHGKCHLNGDCWKRASDSTHMGIDLQTACLIGYHSPS